MKRFSLLLLALACFAGTPSAAYAAKAAEEATERDDEHSVFDVYDPGAGTVGAEDDPGSGGPTPAEVPIDGGIGWLALAGAGYAVRRLRRPAQPVALSEPV